MRSRMPLYNECWRRAGSTVSEGRGGRSMKEGAMADRPGRVFDYGAFRHPTSPLFRDYLAGQPKALAFYGGGGWDLPALLEASRRALSLERPRDAVASALVRQQEARG